MLRNRTTLIPAACVALVLGSTLVGCASLSKGRETVKPLACVFQDERLGSPFSDREKAKKWLRSTASYLVEMAARIKAKQFTPTQEDIQRFADLADLVERAQKCLE